MKMAITFIVGSFWSPNWKCEVPSKFTALWLEFKYSVFQQYLDSGISVHFSNTEQEISARPMELLYRIALYTLTNN